MSRQCPQWVESCHCQPPTNATSHCRVSERKLLVKGVWNEGHFDRGKPLRGARVSTDHNVAAGIADS
jgi:hypothetical protein